MKAVIQRVKSASVSVNQKIIGSINNGLLVLLGVHESDSLEQVDWMAQKIAKLRIFEDDNEKMNLSVLDIKGSVLVVSQFTLYGDARKGTRPSFIEAARPETAIPLYEAFINKLKNDFQILVETGEFGAMMDVSLINDGPVTIILEK